MQTEHCALLRMINLLSSFACLYCLEKLDCRRNEVELDSFRCVCNVFWDFWGTAGKNVLPLMS